MTNVFTPWLMLYSNDQLCLLDVHMPCQMPAGLGDATCIDRHRLFKAYKPWQMVPRIINVDVA